MNRCSVLTDAIRRAGDEGKATLDALDNPDNDFNYYAKRALLAMQEQARLNTVFQDALDSGTLTQEVEVYTVTTLHHMPERTTTEYWRLMPEKNEPTPLSGGSDGYSDAFTASRERRMAWPDAFYISPELFNSAVSEKYRTEHDYYRDSFQVGTHRRGRF